MSFVKQWKKNRNENHKEKMEKKITKKITLADTHRDPSSSYNGLFVYIFLYEYKSRFFSKLKFFPRILLIEVVKKNYLFNWTYFHYIFFLFGRLLCNGNKCLHFSCYITQLCLLSFRFSFFTSVRCSRT